MSRSTRGSAVPFVGDQVIGTIAVSCTEAELWRGVIRRRENASHSRPHHVAAEQRAGHQRNEDLAGAGGLEKLRAPAFAAGDGGVQEAGVHSGHRADQLTDVDGEVLEETGDVLGGFAGGPAGRRRANS